MFNPSCLNEQEGMFFTPVKFLQLPGDVAHSLAGAQKSIARA